VKNLIYIEENYITPEECQKFIQLSKDNQKPIPYGDPTRGGDTYLTNVEWKNHGASYHGGNIDVVIPSLEDKVVSSINALCKSFDNSAELDYVGVVRWPVGTFMKPHVDDNNVHNPDVFAAMLYLNDDFEGGHTLFEQYDIKPEVGKLIVFSNSQLLHYVSKVEDRERFVLSFWYKRLTPPTD
jgi:hypothetical protein